ncbi:MAG: hypothetical protein ACOC4Y_02275 [bacterium]
MNMNTPVGKIPVRETVIEKADNMSKEEIFRECDKTGFVDPELLTIIRQKGLYEEYLAYREGDN